MMHIHLSLVLVLFIQISWCPETDLGSDEDELQ